MSPLNVAVYINLGLHGVTFYLVEFLNEGVLSFILIDVNSRFFCFLLCIFLQAKKMFMLSLQKKITVPRRKIHYNCDYLFGLCGVECWQIRFWLVLAFEYFIIKRGSAPFITLIIFNFNIYFGLTFIANKYFSLLS
ncbi:hypothetical protein MS2017_0833 [Bathymodiolus thermophilus thioautotrophic gill symbiont]|uniref:Uncharacterized protein n=1 Tax=Bathymodiolus thermophilus thioautotrophic gill symbiont TaxID=2360 RepID=A0A3G3IL83_9GAMM|nr:hypothetical protein MS2017_0833 [Bathymodiolus thermophilus thioautotrophic gill symbiont]